MQGYRLNASASVSRIGGRAYAPALRELAKEVPPDVMNPLIEAYRVSFKDIWIILGSFALVGLITSMFTRELSIEEEDMGRQRLEPS